jgi:hypothetical protein
MPVINAAVHHSAFNNGQQIAAIYQGTTKVWPPVVSTAASQNIVGRDQVVPHFDVELVKGVPQTFPPKWKMPQNRSEAPYSAGYPPYGIPNLFCTFRVERIEGATGNVGIKFGVAPFPGQPAGATADASAFFAYSFDNLILGKFYRANATSVMSWADFAPDDSNLVFCGEVQNANKVFLTNMTFVLNW